MKDQQVRPSSKMHRFFTLGGVALLTIMLLGAFSANVPTDTGSVLHLLTQRIQKAFAADPAKMRQLLAKDATPPPAVQLSPAHPVTPEPNPGATFDVRQVSLTYTQGQKVVLSGSQDGQGKLFVDDIVSLTVIQPDNSTAGPREIRFTPPCDTTNVTIKGKAPIDITSYFAPGQNTVIATFKDGCSPGTTGPNHTSSTELWLVPVQPSFWSPATARLGLNCAFNAILATAMAVVAGFAASLVLPEVVGMLAAFLYSANLLEAAIIAADIQAVITPTSLLHILAGLIPVAAASLLGGCLGGQLPFFERHWACQIAPDDALGNCADEPKQNTQVAASSKHLVVNSNYNPDPLVMLENGTKIIQSWMADPNLLCQQVPGTTTDGNTGLCVNDRGAYYTNTGQRLGMRPCGAVASSLRDSNSGFMCLTADRTAYDFNGTVVGTCKVGVPDRVGDCVNGDDNIYDPNGNVIGQVNQLAKTDMHFQYIRGVLTNPDDALA